MKYIYIKIWSILAYQSFLIDRFIYIPFLKFLKSIKVFKTQKDLLVRYKSVENSNNHFPMGIIDWYAFSFLLIIILLPLAIIPSLLGYKFQIKNGYTIYFIIVTIITLSLTVYNIYFKNKEWLKKEISKRKKKYSLSKLLENE